MLDPIDQEQTAADAPAIEPQAEGVAAQIPATTEAGPADPKPAYIEIPAAEWPAAPAEQPDEAERAILRAYTDHTKHHEA